MFIYLVGLFGVSENLSKKGLSLFSKAFGFQHRCTQHGKVSLYASAWNFANVCNMNCFLKGAPNLCNVRFLF